MIMEEGLITEVIDIAAASTESKASEKSRPISARSAHDAKGCAAKSRGAASHCVARARRAQHRASAGAAKVQARRVKQRRGGEPCVPESGFFVGESAQGANGPRQVTFEPFKKAGKY